MNKTVLLAIGFIVLVVGMIVYSSMAGTKKFRVEVCMEFQGRRQCRTASASTEQQAARTARENACALISSGVTDTIQCEQYTQPISVKLLDGK